MSQKILFGRKRYGCLDSSGCPEVHADGGLGDLQVGQTAEVLKDRKTGFSAQHKMMMGWKKCVRASGSERNVRSYKHGKGSHVVLPVLSMTWQRARHDHFRYRLGGGAPTFSERTEHYSTNIDPAQN